MRYTALLPIAALVVAGACASDLATSPTSLAPSLDLGNPNCEDEGPVFTLPEYNCELDDPDYDPGHYDPSWPFFAPSGDALYEAAGDPSSGKPGLWLGSTVQPSFCFADKAPFITDADYDWLDDYCELVLARAFAPSMHFTSYDRCPDGEPYWAVKYFTNGIIRIAYMPAYYDDCGYPAHRGDSEFILVEVKFNPGTRHWEFVRMWLSAHFGEYEPLDRSSWVGPIDAHFTKRNLAHPAVWVALDKHANYRGYATCNNEVLQEFCASEWNTAVIRFPVMARRNVGSRHNDLVGCVESEKRFAGNGEVECFYTFLSAFRGWHLNQPTHEGPIAYGAWLLSQFFENRDGDRGPGPAPAYFVAAIGGPTWGYAGGTASWSAQITNGSGHYSYEWRVNGTLVGTGATYTRALGTQGFTLALNVYDQHRLTSDGDQISFTIKASPTCGMSICLPGIP